VSPFLYTGVAFSTLIGWWMFDHLPDALAFMGMGLVVLCGIVAGRNREATLSKPSVN
jgi:drug/metabolite transporter (DMT)-like permease